MSKALESRRQIIQYVVGTLQPKLKRFLSYPLPKTLEQLIQRGKEVQGNMDHSEEPSPQRTPEIQSGDSVDSVPPSTTASPAPSNGTQPEPPSPPATVI